MAHYGRDYDREFGEDFDRGFGGRGPGNRRPASGFGGMRSDGWGGNEDWRDFAGEEGWYGGFRGGPREGSYDSEYRNRGGRRNEGGLFGDPHGRDFGESRNYGGDYRRRGGMGRSQEGFRGSNAYSEGWDDGHSRSSSGGGLFGQGRGQYRAADIMTENPHTVTPDTPITDVARRMRDLDVGIIPVVDSEDSRRLRGVITDRDIAVRAVAEGKTGNAKVSDCMTERVRHVNKNDSIQDVMRVMRQEQVRRVPVTDREGRLVGIIAQADLAVDYASSDDERSSEVGEFLEQVSEPARPRRGGNRMAAGSRRGTEETGEGEG